MEGTWVQGHLAALWTQRHKSVWLQDFHRTLFNTQWTSNSYPQDPLSDCADHPAFQVPKYCFWEPGETNDQMHEWWALTNNSRIACLSEIKERNLKSQSNTRAKCPLLLHCNLMFYKCVITTEMKVSHTKVPQYFHNSIVPKFGVSKNKLILLFSKNALNSSKVPVKASIIFNFHL